MEKPSVTIYYKNGCHLCEDMWQHLNELQEAEFFEIKTVDIETNNKLMEQYGSLIPVLEGGGEELCHYYLDEVALRGYLSSQLSKVS